MGILDLGREGDIRAPLRDSNVLPVQVAVYVPSTKNMDEELTDSGFKSRIESERKWMDRTWGGDTTIRSSGGFTNQKGRLITEDVAIVESSTSIREYRQNRKKFAEHIKKRKEQWGQEQIGFEIEGRFFLYPAMDFAPRTDVEDLIDVV